MRHCFSSPQTKWNIVVKPLAVVVVVVIVAAAAALVY